MEATMPDIIFVHHIPSLIQHFFLSTLYNKLFHLQHSPRHNTCNPMLTSQHHTTLGPFYSIGSLDLSHYSTGSHDLKKHRTHTQISPLGSVDNLSFPHVSQLQSRVLFLCYTLVNAASIFIHITQECTLVWISILLFASS